jgi:hypothetical protein
MIVNPEAARPREARTSGIPWRKWGPYLSERQWGTVREDYCENGDAWDYLSHTDPRWKDYLLFYEYFHGDNGAGIGASHQTGWTGVIASLIRMFGRINAEQYLSAGNAGVFAKKTAAGG